MATVYTVVSTKGGVGKSTISWHVLPAVFQSLGRDFKIFEIDNNNSTNIFSNSKVIANNTKNVKTDDRDITAEIIFETLSSETEIVIDAGGGDDAIKVIDIVKSVGNANIKWIIPLNRNLAQLKNAMDTYEKIKDKENTLFVLNGYSELAKIQEDFIFWYGDKNLNIDSMKKMLKVADELKIPYSSYFEIAEQQSCTLHDLSLIAKQINKETAKKMFFEKFKDDKQAFLKAWADYRLSENAGIVVDEILENFLPFFQK